MRSVLLVLLVFVTASLGLAQQKHAMTFQDMISWGRVTDPQISPDGNIVAYTITYYSLETNKSNSDIWIVPLHGGTAKELTNAPGPDFSPRWMPDGATIAYISSRDGDAQIYTVPVTGGEPKKMTSVSTGVSGFTISKDGKWFAFSSDIFPECANDSCNKARSDQLDNGPVKAKIFTRLPYRVWNHFLDGKRSHVFVVSTAGGTPVDATPGDFDTPPIDLGGTLDYVFSPDGKELAFVRNTDSVVAVSTNNDIFVEPLHDGIPGEPRRITAYTANDNQPVYSPDGRCIAYRATKRPGFESDRSVLTIYDRTTGAVVPLTEKFDRSVADVCWAPDGQSLYFDADDQGYHSIYRVTDIFGGSPKVTQLTRNTYISEFALAPDGRSIVLNRTSVTNPHELWVMNATGGTPLQLTTTNDRSISRIEWNPLESFWFKGAGGTSVEGFLLKPPHFDPAKKYPLVVLVHGGPQGAWEDLMHYRWNLEMFASPGYVVVMINPRGSTGYGQKFTDEISGDWGGKVYTDLMNGVRYAIKTYPFIDGNRVGAAGASFGGYMMNWIEGHNDDGLFKVLVSHDGMFNSISTYGSTEELWFNQWEFKGTPWTNRKLYDRFSPSNYVEHFKTPMLVIHSQLDYRLDVSEGYQLFTALQQRHVPSKMLYFPDEGHFVLKPRNSQLWHATVFDWLGRYLKP